MQKLSKRNENEFVNANAETDCLCLSQVTKTTTKFPKEEQAQRAGLLKQPNAINQCLISVLTSIAQK